MTKSPTKRVAAFGMYSYRKILKIPWTAKVSNKKVLERVGETNNFLKGVITRKLIFMGHIMRHSHSRLTHGHGSGKAPARETLKVVVE